MALTPPARAIKLNLANEGLEAQRVETEKNERKRKADADKAWEGTSFVLLLLHLLTDRVPQRIEKNESGIGETLLRIRKRRRKSRILYLGKVCHGHGQLHDHAYFTFFVFFLVLLNVVGQIHGETAWLYFER